MFHILSEEEDNLDLKKINKIANISLFLNIFFLNSIPPLSSLISTHRYFIRWDVSRSFIFPLPHYLPISVIRFFPRIRQAGLLTSLYRPIDRKQGGVLAEGGRGKGWVKAGNAPSFQPPWAFVSPRFEIVRTRCCAAINSFRSFVYSAAQIEVELFAIPHCSCPGRRFFAAMLCRFFSFLSFPLSTIFLPRELHSRNAVR